MPISVLDDSLNIEIFFDLETCDDEDCICVQFVEDCPDDEKIFRGDETNIYLTSDQARALAAALVQAANQADE
jgi:hypothetical protein